MIGEFKLHKYFPSTSFGHVLPAGNLGGVERASSSDALILIRFKPYSISTYASPPRCHVARLTFDLRRITRKGPVVCVVLVKRCPIFSLLLHKPFSEIYLTLIVGRKKIVGPLNETVKRAITDFLWTSFLRNSFMNRRRRFFCFP